MKPASKSFYEKLNGLFGSGTQTALNVFSFLMILMIVGLMGFSVLLVGVLSALSYTRPRSEFYENIFKILGPLVGLTAAAVCSFVIRVILSVTAKKGGFENMSDRSAMSVRILTLLYILFAVVSAMLFLFLLLSGGIIFDIRTFAILSLLFGCPMLRMIFFSVICFQLTSVSQKCVPSRVPVVFMMIFTVATAAVLTLCVYFFVILPLPFFVLEYIQLSRYLNILSEERRSCVEEPDTPENKKPDK